MSSANKLPIFVIAFGLAITVIYTISASYGLAAVHLPSGDQPRLISAGRAARSGEGPAMYWYGWTATMLIGGADGSARCRLTCAATGAHWR